MPINNVDTDQYGATEVNLRKSDGAELLGLAVSAASLPVVLSSDHAALPLPVGASTSALQTSGNASLTSIDGKLPALISNRIPVAIFNTTTGYQLDINADGSINTIPLVNPPAPANTTKVVVTGFGSVASTSGVDTLYTIPNGETLTIQNFAAGAEQNTGGSVITLFEDPNGDLSVLNRIATLYVDGSSTFVAVQQDFAGDGTRRIVLRRRGFSSNGREMFGQWSGYRE